jgi:hypothetical protein
VSSCLWCKWSNLRHLVCKWPHGWREPPCLRCNDHIGAILCCDHRYLISRLSLQVVYLWRHVSSTAPPFILWWSNLEIPFGPLHRSSPFTLRCQAIQTEHGAYIVERTQKAVYIVRCQWLRCKWPNWGAILFEMEMTKSAPSYLRRKWPHLCHLVWDGNDYMGAILFEIQINKHLVWDENDQNRRHIKEMKMTTLAPFYVWDANDQIGAILFVMQMTKWEPSCCKCKWPNRRHFVFLRCSCEFL